MFESFFGHNLLIFSINCGVYSLQVFSAKSNFLNYDWNLPEWSTFILPSSLL